MKRLFINTSIEDMTSSIRLLNPKEPSEAKKFIEELQYNIMVEGQNRNRSSVIKLLKNKITSILKNVDRS